MSTASNIARVTRPFKADPKMEIFNLAAAGTELVRVEPTTPDIPMPLPITIPHSWKRFGAPSQIWIYRTPQIGPFRAVRRWDKAGGTMEVRQEIWDGVQYKPTSLGKHRPLHGAHCLRSEYSALVAFLAFEGGPHG